MNLETALYLLMATNGIFTVGAVAGAIRATRNYWRLSRVQKFYFWIAAPTTVVALVWVTSTTFLVTHPWVAPIVPQWGWNILIFTLPTAAIAASLTMGVFLNPWVIRMRKED